MCGRIKTNDLKYLFTAPDNRHELDTNDDKPELKLDEIEMAVHLELV